MIDIVWYTTNYGVLLVFDGNFYWFNGWMVFNDWLVVWNMNFIFPYIGNSNPNWLSYFSEGWLNNLTTNQWCFIMENPSMDDMGISILGHLMTPLYIYIHAYIYIHTYIYIYAYIYIYESKTSCPLGTRTWFIRFSSASKVVSRAFHYKVVLFRI